MHVHTNVWVGGCLHVSLNANTHGTYIYAYGQLLQLHFLSFFFNNAYTIREIWYFNLMHYDMCVIVGIPKSVYPLHVHMKRFDTLLGYSII